jgi:hypothetical protein
VTVAAGRRITWQELPARVRGGVEDILGAAVVEAVGQAGGFSPGSADRVRAADGRRAFVKAVGASPNPRAPLIHRREIEVTTALPPRVPAPRLLGSYDDGDWVALVLEDVPGRAPATPWRASEASLVMAALAGMATALTPAPLLGGSSPGGEIVASGSTAWQRIAADPPPDLDPWAAAHVDLLAATAARAAGALAGDTLCHLDVRADNLLVGSDGRVTVVDWPWASPGPPWLDSLLLAVNVRLYGGGVDTEALLASSPVTAAADPADISAVLAGLAGSFADLARQPAPPGLPTLRAFQQAHADALIPWVRARLGAA